MYLLTATGYAEEDVSNIVSQTGKDIRIFLTCLVEDGKRQNEIRKDFPTKNIVESLLTMYMGIQSFWLTFEKDNVDFMFEKNFDISWQAIKCQ